MASKYRIQVKTITIPNATNPGTITAESETLANDYKQCIGLCLHVASNANDDPINIQIKDEDGVIVDYIHSEHLTVNPSTAMNDRWHKANFKALGKKVFINADPIAATTANVTFQIAFLLER